MSLPICPVHGKEYEPIGFSVFACPEKNCSHGTTAAALEDARDKAKREKRKTVKEKVLEADLDAEVTQRLELAGYEVLTVGGSRRAVECEKCHHKSYGNHWQGNTPFTPDKQIRNPNWPRGVWLDIELKGSATPVSEGQQALCDREGSYICRSWEEVWSAVRATEDSITEARLAKVGAPAVNRLRGENGL